MIQHVDELLEKLFEKIISKEELEILESYYSKLGDHEWKRFISDISEKSIRERWKFDDEYMTYNELWIDYQLDKIESDLREIFGISLV